MKDGFSAKLRIAALFGESYGRNHLKQGENHPDLEKLLISGAKTGMMGKTETNRIRGEAAMYINSGYLRNSRIDFKDHTRPLVVGSCGTYRLSGQPDTLPTHRPRGRVDYQLLYVAAGRARFFFNGREETVGAGNIVLYCPIEEQRYIYCGADHPEVFWVHFTGYDAKNILRYYRLVPEQHVYHTGTRAEFRWIFQRMILELQLCKPLYEEMLASLLNDLMLLICRQQELGRQPDTIQEIADFVGYGDALYFGRLFKRQTGMTPSQYRRQYQNTQN